MSEWSDWGGQGLPGGDTTDVGSGADPYTYTSGEGYTEGYTGDSSDPYADTDPTGGVLSGGMIGTGDSMLPGLVRNAGMTVLGRPGGYALFQDSNLPNLGTSPGVRLRSQGTSSAATAGAIVRSVRDSTGLRVSARGIVSLITRYGFPAAARLTGLALDALQYLWMRQKGVTHHRRGPGLYTIAKRLRAADRLRATVSRVLGGHRHRARRRAPPFHHMRKRKR